MALFIIVSKKKNYLFSYNSQRAVVLNKRLQERNFATETIKFCEVVFQNDALNALLAALKTNESIKYIEFLNCRFFTKQENIVARDIQFTFKGGKFQEKPLTPPAKKYRTPPTVSSKKTKLPETQKQAPKISEAASTLTTEEVEKGNNQLSQFKPTSTPNAISVTRTNCNLWLFNHGDLNIFQLRPEEIKHVRKP